MPLGIIELLTRIGEDNIRLQNLMESATNFQGRGKRGARACAVTFLTDQITPSEVLQEHPQHVGLVLWLPTALVEKAKTDHDHEADARVGA